MGADMFEVLEDSSNLFLDIYGKQDRKQSLI